MRAMPQAQVSLSFPACSTFSSLLIVLTHNTNRQLHNTLNTLHQMLHNTLTIHSKHAKCHKSLNSQNSLSLSLSLFCCCPSHSFPCSSATNQITCFAIRFCDWLVWCLFPPIGMCFFLFVNTSCLRKLLWQKPVFTVSSCTRHKANVTAMFAKKRGGHYLS